MRRKTRANPNPARAGVALITLPYDSGHFEERMGRGPGALIAAGLIEQLRMKNFDAAITPILLPESFQTEASALVELQGKAVAEIRMALSRGAKPILLSGNCGPAALSATAALGAESTGVIWFDAHGDFNSPETSPSGFLDGMGLSILTGQCWRKLAERLEGFAPVPMEHIIQVGVRDVDPEEGRRLEESSLVRVARNELSSLPEVVKQLAARVPKVYVHVDVDVLDLSEGSANSYACAGGLSLDELHRALQIIGGPAPDRGCEYHFLRSDGRQRWQNRTRHSAHYRGPCGLRKPRARWQWMRGKDRLPIAWSPSRRLTRLGG